MRTVDYRSANIFQPCPTPPLRYLERHLVGDADWPALTALGVYPLLIGEPIGIHCFAVALLGVHRSLLLDSIHDAHDAVEKDCLIPVLTSVHTIPDEMGQCLYPDLVYKKADDNGNHKRDIGKQYARWFDTWVASGTFLFPDPANEKACQLSTKIFDGKACYRLRCSPLHSGDYDVTPSRPHDRKDETYEYKFELCLHACDGMVVTWSGPSEPGTKPGKRALYTVDIKTLATAICDGAERCLTETCGYVAFPNLRVINFVALAERMRNPQSPSVLCSCTL